MQRTTVIDVLTKLFPEETIRREAAATGAVKRRRKVDIVAMFWTLVLGYGVGKTRTLAELRRAYENRTKTGIEESSFYDRFTPALAKLMKRLALQSLERLDVGSHRLTRNLATFRDLLLIDSTVIRLHDLLKGAFAACRTNHTKAAAKLHVVMSVLKASPTQVRLTPERTNDRTPWRKVGPWVKGCLLLFDLGYFSFWLFTRIDDNKGFFLSRLKGNANPLIVSKNRSWRGQARPLVGRRVRDVLPGLKREVIDVNVEVTFKRRAYRGKGRRDRRVFRVVGVFNHETGQYHLYMTNIPPDQLDAHEIAQCYRLRWQIELLFAELKTHYRLDQMPSSKRVIVETLLYSAILTLVASHALLAAVRRRVPKGRDIPPRRWAAVFTDLAPSLLVAIVNRYACHRPPEDPWELLASQAIDPNLGRPYALAEVTCYG